MKFEDELRNKLESGGIEFGVEKREYTNNDGEVEMTEREYAKFPCGREFIKLQYTDRIELDLYKESNIEKFKFIKDFEGIWSPELGAIECELQSVHRFGAPSHYVMRRLAKLFETEIEENTEIQRFSLEPSANGHLVSIGRPSIDYAILSFLKNRRLRFENTRRRPTLRIENLTISKHDDAKKLLNKIGNAVLFKLDMTSNIGFKLAEDIEIRRSYFRKKRSEYELDKSFPLYEYDSEPMSLYWYAKSATEMPLLQFLALYQILEFYYPIFSQKEAHQKIKNLIKDPRFNPNKDSDISKILNSIKQNKNQLGFGSELEQLKATLSSCITNEDILEIIQADEETNEYFADKKSKKIAHKSINLSNLSNLISDCAERIYEIRCRIVHTKVSDKNYKLLLPSSPELKYMSFEISILEQMAKKVLITASRTINI